MKVIQPQVYIESDISEDDAIMLIERAGRVCYKSENKFRLPELNYIYICLVRVFLMMCLYC